MSKPNILIDIENIKGNINADVASLVAHKAESASKHITESGSNTNGSYVKFDDGTLVCWQFSVDVVLSTSLFSGYYRAFSSWTYPHAFFNTVKAFISTQIVNDTSPINGNLYPDGAGSKNLQVFVITASTNYNGLRSPQFFAIGRWKA